MIHSGEGSRGSGIVAELNEGVRVIVAWLPDDLAAFDLAHVPEHGQEERLIHLGVKVAHVQGLGAAASTTSRSVVLHDSVSKNKSVNLKKEISENRLQKIIFKTSNE